MAAAAHIPFHTKRIKICILLRTFLGPNFLGRQKIKILFRVFYCLLIHVTCESFVEICSDFVNCTKATFGRKPCGGSQWLIFPLFIRLRRRQSLSVRVALKANTQYRRFPLMGWQDKPCIYTYYITNKGTVKTWESASSSLGLGLVWSSLLSSSMKGRNTFIVAKGVELAKDFLPNTIAMEDYAIVSVNFVRLSILYSLSFE